ncbi:MAG: F0F1 ATP synthase subunit A [Bradymonadales bacterium]|nr:MAG: F0F1 ATP synthase subunit A [Bradymonadales bacterium]
MAAGRNIYETIGIESPYTYFSGAVLSGLLLIGLGFFVRRKLSKAEVLPEDGFTLFNAGVELVRVSRNFVWDLIGPGAEKYLPIVLTAFLLILFNNLSGFIPGFLSASEHLSLNLGMAAFVFLSYQFLGFKEHGFGYLKQFTGGLPVPGYGLAITLLLSVIAIVVFAVELVGHVVRPGSLSIRLFGAIFGDHKVLESVSELVPLFVPIVAMALGLMVSLIQAFVFSVLSVVYIKLAVSHDH